MAPEPTPTPDPKPSGESTRRQPSGPDPAPGRADRGPLLGLLALQDGLIGEATLVDALHAWVVDKRKPIGSILKDWGALDDGQVALLARKVEGRADDPGPGATGQDSTQAGTRTEGRPDATTDEATASFGDSWPSREARGEPHPRAAFPCRYRKPDHEPHARGGLGVVFLADDLELGRQVALKEINPLHAFDDQARARFVLEGEVTGNLEHPGIVPVYGLGGYDDGRPYYAMRFIRGKDLKQTVREARNGKGDPLDRVATLRKLVRRLVDVCNAVEYAHSRGVLHRDLKPANIMLGPYGETLVVDWGLAKVTGHAEGEAWTLAVGPAEPPLDPSCASTVEPTRKGAIGTLEYMSPEQAAGQSLAVDHRTDVFGIGATLYYTLTGQAPHPGGDRATPPQAEGRRPRDLDPTVPRPLEAICLKALAAEPADRYPSALALGEDLDRWLGDEPVRAYPDPPAVRLLRWAKRHRSKVVAAATLLVAAVVGLAISNVLLDRERTVSERARRDAVDTLLVTGEAIQRLMIGQVVEQLNNLSGTVSIRRNLGNEAIVIAQKYRARWPNDPVVAAVAGPVFHLTANLDQSLGQFARADASYGEAERLYDRALRSDLANRTTLLVDSIRLTLDHAEALNACGRRPEAIERFAEARGRIDQLRAEEPEGHSYQMLLARHDYDAGFLARESGDLAGARRLFDESAMLLGLVLAREPGNTMAGLIRTIALTGQGAVSGEQGRHADAALAFEAALENASKQEQTATIDSTRALALEERGRWELIGLGRPDRAESTFDQARAIAAQLARDLPDFPIHHEQLAWAHLGRGLAREALGPDRRDAARLDAREAGRAFAKLRELGPMTALGHSATGLTLGLLARLEPVRAERRRFLEKAVEEQSLALRDVPTSPRDLDALRKHRDVLAAEGPN